MHRGILVLLRFDRGLLRLPPSQPKSPLPHTKTFPSLMFASDTWLPQAIALGFLFASYAPSAASNETQQGVFRHDNLELSSNALQPSCPSPPPPKASNLRVQFVGAKSCPESACAPWDDLCSPYLLLNAAKRFLDAASMFIVSQSYSVAGFLLLHQLTNKQIL